MKESENILFESKKTGGTAILPMAESFHALQTDWLERRKMLTQNPNLISERIGKTADEMGITLDHFDKQMNTRFITGVLAASPLPPVRLDMFVKQILSSQSTHGEIPLVLQAVSCLNYRFNPETNLEEILPINDKTQRWHRFVTETGDFLVGLNELRVRPLLVFGASDTLDFEGEDTYAYAPEELHQRVRQNIDVMKTTMQEEISNLSVPYESFRPQVAVFTHGSRLVEGHLHQKTFEDQKGKLREHAEEMENFRKWLISRFSESHPYLARLSPADHHEQMTQMMGLYAADNQISVETARELFPEETISHVTSLCLQPTHIPEWISEKVAATFLGNESLSQLTPFPNSGKWWMKKEPIAQFSLRNERKELVESGAGQAFRTLIKKADAEIIPEVNREGLDLADLILLKKKRVRRIVETLFGVEKAELASEEYDMFLQARKESRGK